MNKISILIKELQDIQKAKGDVDIPSTQLNSVTQTQLKEARKANIPPLINVIWIVEPEENDQ